MLKRVISKLLTFEMKAVTNHSKRQNTSILSYDNLTSFPEIKLQRPLHR